jgi:hypothetical protein
LQQAAWPEEGQGNNKTGGDFPYEGWWNNPEEILNH